LASRSNDEGSPPA